MIEREQELFGGKTRTHVLLTIRMLEDTYASELAEVLGVSLFAIQKMLLSFERESVIATRTMGRTRMISLNPRYFAYDELRALLWKMGEHDVALQQQLATRRRRPRRTGKPGLL